jgi:hypothetical protein
MGKRSDFDRNPRDFYPTPWEAVVPLFPHLPLELKFWEPCAGDKALVDHIDSVFFGSCGMASDIDPQHPEVTCCDALAIDGIYAPGMTHIITNPPWNRKILHPMIEKFSALRPTWLLFDADWMHTKQSVPYQVYLRKVVSVGRVKWIPDSKMTGKDNAAWYLFDRNDPGPTEFVGPQV